MTRLFSLIFPRTESIIIIAAFLLGGYLFPESKKILLSWISPYNNWILDISDVFIGFGLGLTVIGFYPLAAILVLTFLIKFVRSIPRFINRIRGDYDYIDYDEDLFPFPSLQVWGSRFLYITKDGVSLSLALIGLCYYIDQTHGLYWIKNIMKENTVETAVFFGLFFWLLMLFSNKKSSN